MSNSISRGPLNRGDGYERLSSDSFNSTASTAYSDSSNPAQGSADVPAKAGARGWLSKKFKDFKKSLEPSESTLVKGGGISSKSWNFFDLLSRSKSNNRKSYFSYIGKFFNLHEGDQAPQAADKADYQHVAKALDDVRGEKATDIGVKAQKKAMAGWRAESDNLLGKNEVLSLQELISTKVWDDAVINDPVTHFFGVATNENCVFHKALKDNLEGMREKGLQGDSLVMLTYALSFTANKDLKTAAGALAYFKESDFVDSIKNIGRAKADRNPIQSLGDKKVAARAAWQMAQNLALSKDGMDALVLAMKSCKRADGKPGVIMGADEMQVVQVFLQAAKRSRDCGCTRDLPSEFSAERRNADFEGRQKDLQERIRYIEFNNKKNSGLFRTAPTPEVFDKDGKSLDVLKAELEELEIQIKRNPKLLYDGMRVAAKRLEIFSHKFKRDENGNVVEDLRKRVTPRPDELEARQKQGIVLGDLEHQEADVNLFSKEERYAYSAIRCGFNEDTPDSDLAKADRQTYKFTYKWIPRLIGTKVRDIVGVDSSPYEKVKRLVFALGGKDTNAKITYKQVSKPYDSFNLFRKMPLQALKRKSLERASQGLIGEMRAAKEAQSNFVQNAPALIEKRLSQFNPENGKLAPIALLENAKNELLEDCVRASVLKVFNSINHKFFKSINGKQLNETGEKAVLNSVIELLQGEKFKAASQSYGFSQATTGVKSTASSPAAVHGNSFNNFLPNIPNVADEFVTEMFEELNKFWPDAPVRTTAPVSSEVQSPASEVQSPALELPFGITKMDVERELAKYKNTSITPALLEDWAKQMISRIPHAPDNFANALDNDKVDVRDWNNFDYFRKNLKLAKGEAINLEELSSIKEGDEANRRGKLASIFTKYLERAELTTRFRSKSGWGRGLTLRNPGSFAFSVLANKTVLPVQPNLNAAYVQTVQSVFDMGLSAQGAEIILGKQRSHLRQFGAGLFVGVRNALNGFGISVGLSGGASSTKDLSHQENIVFRMDRTGREAKPDVNGHMVKKRLPTLDGDAEVMQEMAKVGEILVRGVSDKERAAGWTPMKHAMADHWDDLSVKYVNPDKDQEIARRTTLAVRAGAVADMQSLRIGPNVGGMYDRRTLRPKEQFHKETTLGGVGLNANRSLDDEHIMLAAGIGVSESEKLGRIGTTGVSEGTVGADGSYAIDVKRTGVFVRSNIVAVNGEIQAHSYVTTHYENAKLYIDTLMGSTCTKAIDAAVNSRLDDAILHKEAEIIKVKNEESVNKKKNSLQSINKLAQLKREKRQLQMALRMREKLYPLEAQIAPIQALVDTVEESLASIKYSIEDIEAKIKNAGTEEKSEGKKEIAQLKAQKLKLDVELMRHNSKLKPLQMQKTGLLLKLEMARQGDTILKFEKQERRNLLRMIFRKFEDYDNEIAALDNIKNDREKALTQAQQHKLQELNELKSQLNEMSGRVIPLIKNLAVFDKLLSGGKFDLNDELKRGVEELADYFDRIEKDAHPTQNFVEYAQLPKSIADIVNKYRAKAKIAEANGDLVSSARYNAEADRMLRTPEAWVTDFLLVLDTSYDVSKAGATLFAMANKQKSSETSNVRSYVVAVKSNFVK